MKRRGIFLVISAKVRTFATTYWLTVTTETCHGREQGFSGSTSATFGGNNNDMSRYLENIET